MSNESQGMPRGQPFKQLMARSHHVDVTSFLGKKSKAQYIMLSDDKTRR